MPQAPSNRPPSLRPAADDAPPAGASFLIRLGTGIGMGALASAVAVLPAMFRLGSALAPSASSPPQVWAGLAALELLPMTIAVLVLRQARIGLRPFGGPGASARVLAVALWLFLLARAFMWFGASLRKNTHHHALAGVTFAIVAAGLAVVLALVCGRLATIIAARTERTRFIVVAIGAVLLLAAIAYTGFTLARSLQGDAAPPPTTAASIVDGLAFAIAAGFASRWELAQSRRLAVAGPLGAALLLLVGMITLVGSSEVRESVAARAPVFGLVLGAVEPH